MQKVVSVAVVLVLALAAQAAPVAKPDPTAEAKRLYAEGTAAYNLSEYATAIEKYKAAYKLVPSPYLVYNIAQSYRLSKDFEQALEFYDKFLTQLPKAPNRAEVEGFITDLKAQIAARDQAAATPPKTVVEPPPGDSPPAAIPSPVKVAATTDTGKPEGPAPEGSGKRPIYKKWWFWAGIGAVAVGATVLAVTASGGNSDPDTHFPRKELF